MSTTASMSVTKQERANNKISLMPVSSSLDNPEMLGVGGLVSNSSALRVPSKPHKVGTTIQRSLPAHPLNDTVGYWSSRTGWTRGRAPRGRTIREPKPIPALRNHSPSLTVCTCGMTRYTPQILSITWTSSELSHPHFPLSIPPPVVK
jgi:hypothetical protein